LLTLWGEVRFRRLFPATSSVEYHAMPAMRVEWMVTLASLDDILQREARDGRDGDR
jgi:hypothetical protein